MEVLSLTGPWYTGSVLVIGDTAHSGTPHLAEGAAMAIKEVVVLAEMLLTSTDLDQALTEFCYRRKTRARLVFEAGLNWVNGSCEFAGRLDPEANPGALFAHAY